MSAMRVSSLTQTCERNPSQWEGSTDDGTYIYARYRWGCLSIGSGMTIEEAVKLRNAIGLENHRSVSSKHVNLLGGLPS